MQFDTTSDQIKISAIIPNYNCAKLLPKAIQSLIDQTEKFTEIIIIDDASTDESLSVITHFIDQHNYIRLIQHEKNQGVCKTLNHGLEQATGDYILLGAADDWYGCNNVALVKQAAKKFPGAGLICGNAISHSYESNRPFHRMMCFSKKNDFITPDEFRSITKTDYVGFTGGGLFMNRKAALAAGKIHPETAWYSDWLLYFVLAFEHGLYYTDEIFIHSVKRKESYSGGMRDWEKEKPVFLNLLIVMQKNYPHLWKDFRKAALLPHYDLRYFSLLLSSRPFRQFFSLRLLWRLILTNKLVVRIGRLFPHQVILRVRKLLRV